MKPQKILLTATIVAGLTFSQTTFAQNAEKAETPVVGVSAHYEHFQEKLGEAEKAAAANNLKSMHRYSEEMVDDLKALQNTELAKDPMIANTLTTAIPVAKSLDTTGDNGDMPGTLTVLKKLQGVNSLLKARMPKASPVEDGKSLNQEAALAASVTASVQSPAVLVPMKESKVVIKLTNANGTPVTEDQLKEVHTRKVHLLVVDQSLSDYHHLHPIAGTEPGTFTASFTPQKENTYKVWADITPANGSQQFVSASMIGEKPCAKNCIEKTITNAGTSEGGLTATLSFKSTLNAGTASMGMVRVTDAEGKPITNLEPVMGAFAHIVGFYDDFSTIAHIHPMGEEPATETDRGGPDLSFHLEPLRAGFVKLYVQMRHAGKDVFIPLGITVE